MSPLQPSTYIESIMPKTSLFLLSFLKARSRISSAKQVPVLNRSYQKRSSWSPHFTKLNWEHALKNVYLYWIDHDRNDPFTLLISQISVMNVFYGLTTYIESIMLKPIHVVFSFLKSQSWMSRARQVPVLNRSCHKRALFLSSFSKSSIMNVSSPGR